MKKNYFDTNHLQAKKTTSLSKICTKLSFLINIKNIF